MGPTGRGWRVAWAGALVLFGYVLLATYSRGGFLALLAGMTALLQGKYNS